MPEKKEVRIVTFRQGQEGRGFEYYALKSVNSDKYLSYNGKFVQTDLYSRDTRHFNTTDEANQMADDLGCVVVETVEE